MYGLLIGSALSPGVVPVSRVKGVSPGWLKLHGLQHSQLLREPT